MNGSSPGGPQAALIKFSIRFRGVVIALACIFLAYGVYNLGRARYDVFPEFAPPQVGIRAEATGLSAQQVEELVTRPIENAVNGVPGVQRFTSTSIQGLSAVTVYFDPSSDIFRDRQEVAERLATVAGQLPQGVKSPSMTPLTSSTNIVLVAGLTSNTRSLMRLRTIADWTVRPRLLAVPGVANVAVFGRDIRSIQIQVHPHQLIRYRLGLEDVLNAARKATGIRGAGFIDTRNQRIIFQSEGQSAEPEEIARTVLLSRGTGSVTLGDVADVVIAPEPPIGAAEINGKPGVILNISEQYGANTVEVTRWVLLALRELEPGLQAQDVILHADLFRPATFISTATGNVRESLIIGAVLVIAVLYLFLFDLRTAAISCAAIPLSLLAATTVLEAFGVTLNTMTLGGLAVAIGVVVDDAVIDVENIVHRLRQNARLPQPRPVARVVLDAAFEVRSAVVYASFAVILVALPIIALSGIAGRLFGPLGLSYIIAVLASLLVALIVTPALCMALLSRRAGLDKEPPVMIWSRTRYAQLLHRIMRHPRRVIAAAVVFTIAGCAALPFFSGSFIPELNEGHFIVHMATVPGTSIEQSLRIGDRIADALRRLPVVRSVAQRIGRAELGEETFAPNYSEFEVDLKTGLSGDQAEEAQADIRKTLAGFVGANFAVNSFLSERIEETLSGYTAEVAVNIFGNDLNMLDEKARQVARVIGRIPGATGVQIQSPTGLPQLTIRLRKRDLERWGFDTTEVLDLVRTAYQGDVVGQTYQGDQTFNVITILDEASRDNIAKVGDLPLRSPGGAWVRLNQIADVFEAPGRYQILHEGGRRLQTVTANAAGEDVASFVRAAKKAIAAQVQLPAGTYIQFAGAAQAQLRAQRDLLVNSIVAGFGIILLLSIVTRKWRNLLLILANLPFAAVGAVLVVFGTGGLLSLGGMIGFVTLFGITLRNSILIIAHYEHLTDVERAPWGLETAIRGAADRVAPILMTSIVTALGVLPLAIGMGAPGREIDGPMAVVILGGLLSSMALNLLVLPTLALRYGRFEREADEFTPTASGQSRR